MPEPIHLHPTAPLAPRVLLPGDPGRALLLAQALLSEPRMFNHNRGLWGYTGDATDGAPLTIQSTGIGGPSAAIVISELADLGAERLVRVGTCGAVVDSLTLGDLLVATEAICGDGTSRALRATRGDAGAHAPADRQAAAGAEGRLAASPSLLAALTRAAGGGAARLGPVASTDLFYRDRPPAEWAAAGALAVEMEAATLFALAGLRELEAGAVLIVSDTLAGDHRRIESEALRAAEHRLGALALGALA
ncbi:MAG: purine-nucleoside phosphorylase [Solirubrobacteraceae bacterium]